MYPNDEDEDDDADSGVSDELMIGETGDVESLNSEGLQKRLRSKQRLSKADEIENEELDDISFLGGLNSEGLDKRLRCRLLNSRHLDDSESEELEEHMMTSKLTKTSSVVDLLQILGSSKNETDSESEFETISKKYLFCVVL